MDIESNARTIVHVLIVRCLFGVLSSFSILIAVELDFVDVVHGHRGLLDDLDLLLTFILFRLGEPLGLLKAVDLLLLVLFAAVKPNNDTSNYDD